MQEYTIYPLVVGINETDQGVMTYLRDYGKRIYLPIYAFYLEGGHQRILVDSGLEEFMVPEGAEKELGYRVREFEDALAAHGLAPEDIDLIIHTHLHNDHCENDYKCSRATIVTQKTEYEFLLDPHPVDHRYFPDILDGLKVDPVEGDARIADGIDVIFSPGHTVGGQSVAVNTARGKAVITGFCCNDKNFPSTGPAIVPGVHINVMDAYQSIHKIRDIADILIPLHDPGVGRKQQIP